MKILFAWHASVEPEYQKVFQELVMLGLDIWALMPAAWTEGGQLQRPTERPDGSYRTLLQPVIFRDRPKRFFYPNFVSIIRAVRFFRPDIVHIFEEPYSLACAELAGLSRIFQPGAKIVIQSFENIAPVHRLSFYHRVEAFVLRRAHAILTVPREGELLWRQRGFKGPIYHVPVGLDETFSGFERLDKRSIG